MASYAVHRLVKPCMEFAAHRTRRSGRRNVVFASVNEQAEERIGEETEASRGEHPPGRGRRSKSCFDPKTCEIRVSGITSTSLHAGCGCQDLHSRVESLG